jgi:hypothetical protein
LISYIQGFTFYWVQTEAGITGHVTLSATFRYTGVIGRET